MSAANHTVELIDGLTIVRCPGAGLPMDLVGKILGRAKKGEVLDVALAGRIGALLVFGLKQDLAAYRATEPAICQAIENEVAAARAAYTGLELQEIVNYLIGYDRGSSADALLMATTGLPLKKEADAVPHDSSDLGRCIRLYGVCSVVRENLIRAGGLLSTWEAPLKESFQQMVDKQAPTPNSGDAPA